MNEMLNRRVRLLEHHTAARRNILNIRTIDFEDEADMQAHIARLEESHPGCRINITDINDATGSYYRDRWKQFTEEFARNHAAATSQSPTSEK